MSRISKIIICLGWIRQLCDSARDHGRDSCPKKNEQGRGYWHPLAAPPLLIVRPKAEGVFLFSQDQA